MKKMLLITAVVMFAASVPVICAENTRADFFKSFSNCKPASYTANFDDGSRIQRTVVGAGSIKGIYACQYKEVYSNGKTLSCAIPMQNLKTTVGAINSGSQEQMFKNYIDSGVCELSE